MYKKIVFGLLLFFALIAAVNAEQGVVEKEIEALINAVQISNCVFERNGKSHDSQDAADHLRLKWRKGKKYAKTTEDFITRLASESSWTGKPYYITCEVENRQKMKRWLTETLQHMRVQ